jgi:hypothetical protein
MACGVLLFRPDIVYNVDDDGTLWYKGMPVEVINYSPPLGEGENPILCGSFFVLYLVDVDKEEVQDILLEPLVDPNEDVILQRRFVLKLDRLPSVLASQLEAYGFLETSYEFIRKYFVDRTTGEVM